MPWLFNILRISSVFTINHWKNFILASTRKHQIGEFYSICFWTVAMIAISVNGVWAAIDGGLHSGHSELLVCWSILTRSNPLCHLWKPRIKFRINNGNFLSEKKRERFGIALEDYWRMYEWYCAGCNYTSRQLKKEIVSVLGEGDSTDESVCLWSEKVVESKLTWN